MRRLSLVSVVVVTLSFVFALAFSTVSPASTATTGMNRNHAIREASKAWDDAFNAEDIEKLMQLYADEAASMPPGFRAVEGKRAIRADFEYIFTNFDWEHETTIVDLLVSGNVAVERGTYTMREGGVLFEVGKHIVIRHKRGNAWLVVWEIWNIDS